MTALLDKAVAIVRDLPPESQDDIARAVMLLAGDGGPAIYQLTEEEEADLLESDAEVARAEFATEEQLRAIWAKYAK